MNTQVQEFFSKWIDHKIKMLTAFDSLKEMINAEGGYFPSINVSDKEIGHIWTIIADAYDREMEKLQDSRRAFRF